MQATRNRHQERSDLSTARLLDAAAELIEEGGYEAMTVAAVGERAGYSRGLVTARFGSKEPDKFAGIDWHPSELGSPVIEGSLANIDCTVASVHDGGDHFVVFGAVKSLSEVPKIKPRPLLFYRGDYTGIEPDKTTPAQWRDDLEAFLTTTTQDTWL